MPNNPPVDLVARWREGDEQAAGELFHQYVEQLVGLARTRLTSRLAQRVDPEDVVQSALRSFFVAARAGKYELQQGSDVWHLLVTITLRKLYHQIRHNNRAKRSVKRQLPPQDNLIELVCTQVPSPLEAMALTDEVEAVMRGLSPWQRRMLEMRLQGYDLYEIAADTQRSLRTVSRTLDLVKSQLENRSGNLLSLPDMSK
jgi:RNA polymerase sigma factor (sigma-70 family)